MRTRRNQAEPLVALPMNVKRPRQLPVDPEVRGAQDQSESPFMKLSAELRNDIYKLAFDGTCSVPNRVKDNPKGLMPTPGLLMACKQTYAEGLKTYYSETKFRFSSKSRLLYFLSRVGTKNGHGPALGSISMVSEISARFVGGGLYNTRSSNYGPMHEENAKKRFLATSESAAIQKAKLQAGVLFLDHRVTFVFYQDVDAMLAREPKKVRTTPFKTWKLEDGAMVDQF